MAEVDFMGKCRAWKATADRLKLNDVPLWGAAFDIAIDKALRKEAAELDKVLDEYVNCELHFNDEANKVCLIMNQGMDPSEFEVDLLAHDFSFKCGAVWNTNSVAYRCNTCAKNSCMSLCQDCFDAGGHKDHDSTRFFSLAGGACDCGSEDTLHPSGFCNRHGAEAVARATEPPKEYLSLTEFVITKLLMKLFTEYRKIPLLIERTYGEDYAGTKAEKMQECSEKMPQGVVDLLMRIINKGAAPRRAIVDILLNEDLYTRCRANPHITDFYVGTHLDDISQEGLNYAFRNLPVLSIITRAMYSDEYVLFLDSQNREPISPRYPEFRTMADELAFWLVRLSYPQSLIDLMLALTSEIRYRDVFGRSIIEYYEYSIQYLADLYAKKLCGHANDLISRMIHVSVQICSSEVVSEKLQREMNAIDVILNAAIRFFSPHVTFRSDVAGGRLYPYIAGDGHYARHRQSYWSFLNDLQNFLSHERLGYQFICNQKLVKKYMILIRVFEGANRFERIVEGMHLEDDNAALGQRLFGVEYELESILLMNLVAAVKKHDHDGAGTRLFLSEVINNLEAFTNSHGLDRETMLPYDKVSLHLPLHRMLSAFLFIGGIYGEHLRLSPSQLDCNFFRQIMLHPLKIMLTLSEATTSMWVRNGASFRSALSFYRHYVFGMSFLDLDTFLIKYCAGVTGPGIALESLFAAFQVKEMLSVALEPGSIHADYYIDPQWIPPMVEALLSRLCEISTFVMTTPDLGGLKRDVLAILFQSDCSHSTITECLCDRGHEWSRLISTKLEEVLKEIADYKTPDSNGETLSDGCYKVKKEFWISDFDPIYSRMRCFTSEQFEELCRKAEKNDKRELIAQEKQIVGHTWIPFRAFSFDFDERGDINSVLGSAILCDNALFEYVGHVLYLNLHHSTVTANAYQQAIYLLTLAVKFYKSSLMTRAVEKCWNDDLRNYYYNKTLLYKLFTIEIKDTNVFNLIVELFRRELSSASKPTDDASLAKALEEQVDQNPEKLERIVGGGIQYIGRLFCFLHRCGEPGIRHSINVLLSKGSSSEENPSKAENDFIAKRLAMKRRRDDFLARLTQKNARILEKMETVETGEGLMEMEVDEDHFCVICKEPGNFSQYGEDTMGTFVYVASAPAHMLSVDTVFFQDDLFEEFRPTVDHTRIFFAKEKATKCVQSKCLKIQFTHAVAGNPSAEIRSCGHLAHTRCYWNLYKDKDYKNNSHLFDHLKSREPCPGCRQDYNGFLPIVNPVDLTNLTPIRPCSKLDRVEAFIMKSIDEFEPVQYGSFEKEFYADVMRLCKEVTKRFNIRVSAESTLLTILENGTLMRMFGQKDHNKRSLLFGALATRVMCDVKHLEAPFTRKFLMTVFNPMNRIRKRNSPKVPTLFFHMKTMLLRGLCFVANQAHYAREDLIGRVMLLFKHILFASLTKNLVLFISRRDENEVDVKEALAVTKSTLSKTGCQYETMCTVLLSALERAPSLDRKPSENSFAYSVSGEIHKIMEHTIREMSLFVLSFINFSNLLSIDNCPEFSSATAKDLFDYLNGIHAQDFSFDENFIVDWVEHYMESAARKIDIELNEPLYWHHRTLFKLPESYEELFKRFHNRPCTTCKRVSDHPLLCLVCGQLVCFEFVHDGRIHCSEILRHARHCTSGSTCFISILTSLIVIVQHYELNIWGSPYLDSHGEEDRLLRRGKPLFLSESRYRLLQRDWLSQSFPGQFTGFSTFRDEIRQTI